MAPRKTLTLDQDAAQIVDTWPHNERGQRVSAAIRHYANQEAHLGSLDGRMAALEAELRAVSHRLAVLEAKQGQ